LSLIIASIGVLALLVGMVGCIIPAIPGPPISAVGSLVLQVGLTLAGPASVLGWGLCVFCVLAGIVMSVADILTPLAVGRLGLSSRRAGRYATGGVLIALILSCTGGGPIAVLTGGLGTIPALLAAVLLVFAGAFVGGAIGEWEEAPRLAPDRGKRAVKSGLVQVAGLGVSLVGKAAYGFMAIIIAVLQAVVQFA
jgi:hypothetical protein